MSYVLERCPDCGALLGPHYHLSKPHYHLSNCSVLARERDERVERIARALEGIWFELEKLTRASRGQTDEVMHTVETETVEHGKARVHYNADFSGSVLISWRGGTAEIPGEVFGALALMLVFEELAKSFLRRWAK